MNVEHQASRAEEGSIGTGQQPELQLLAGLSDEDRARILAEARPLSAEAGHLVIEEGTPGDGLYFLLEGQLEVTRKEGRQEVVLALHGPGAFVGEMSLVEDAPRSATVRAVTPSRLLVIPPDAFRLLLRTSPAATLTILRTVLGRLRSTESSLLHNAKLAGLGTLAAGLAHEINNPAAAVRRGIVTLNEGIAAAERAARDLIRLDPVAAANRPEEPVRGTGLGAVNPIADAEREERLVTWLEERGVERGYELAYGLLACGWDPDSLETVVSGCGPDTTTAMLEWLGWTCANRVVLDELGRATDAISQIVRAVRAYTFLDQAPIQEVDIVETIENTLVILKNRLKEGVRVTRRYTTDLRRVTALGGELTQLWTNLIDNAIDAMGGKGDLEIVVEPDRECIAVRVIDSGPGIPESVLPRIFEPFFTTKGPGQGSGIGLHVAYGVVRRHHGRIVVSSRPGRTEFKVVLPPRGAGPTPAGANEADPA